MDDTTGGEPPSDACVRDTGLIDEARTCLDDDNCPCGAHCDHGECVARCIDDGDCGAEQRCDDFGRCRGAMTSDLLPPPAPVQPPRVVPGTTNISVLPGMPFELDLRVKPGGSDEPVPTRARLVARDGATIDCGDGEVTECDVMVDPDDPPSVDVFPGPAKKADPEAPAMGGGVDIYGDDKSYETVVCTYPDIEPPKDPATAILPGVYEGIAQLEALGIGEAGESGNAVANSMRMPVTIRVFADGTLELVDDVGVFDPSGSLVGTVTGTAVDFPTVLLREGEAIPGEAFELLSVATVDQVAVASASSGFGLWLTTRFEGMLPGQRAPLARWQLAVERVGDTVGDPPAVPDDAASMLEPATAMMQPFGWDQAVRDATEATAVYPGSFLESLAGSADGDVHLDVCAMIDELPAHQDALNEQEPAIDDSQIFEVADVDGVEDPNFLVALAQEVRANAPSAAGAAFVVSSLSINTPLNTRTNLPCDATVHAGLAEATAPPLGDYTTAEVSIDRCDEVAALRGCTVRDVDDFVVDTSGTMGHYDESGSVAGFWSNDRQMTVHRVCSQPHVTMPCIEALNCAESPTVAARSELNAGQFGDTVLPASGDSMCTMGARGASIDADFDPSNMTAEEAFDACRSDLNWLRTTTPLVNPALITGLADVLHPGACLDGSRFAASLSWAADTYARGEADWGPASHRAGRGAFMARQLQRWLQLHRQLAGETVQREALASVFAADPQPGDPSLPDARSILVEADQAWELLLVPRIAHSIDSLDPAVLAAPDYRPYLTSAPVAGGEQAVALPVTIMESLLSEAELAATLVEEGHRQLDLQAVEAARDIMPMFMVSQAIAHELNARVRAVSGTPQWGDRWDTAVARLDRETNRVFQAVLGVRRGLNPLGVEDSDLPLYFFGDETGAGGRFSAISDFLIGSGPNDLSYAPFLVARADDALVDARTAFVGQLDRGYQEALSEAQHQQRLNDIEDEYQESLEELCGSTSGSYLDQENFNASECYIDATCAANAQESDADYYTRVGAPTLAFHLCTLDALADDKGPAAGLQTPEARLLAQAIREDAGCRQSLNLASCAGNSTCLQCSGAVQVPLRPAAFAVADATPAEASGAWQTCLSEWSAHVDSGEVPAGPPTNFGRALPGRELSAALPECMSGSLGAASVAALAAANDVEAARAEAAESTKAYDIAVRSCNLQLEGAAAIETANTQHAEAMGTLWSAIAAADGATAFLAASKECAAAVASGDFDDPAGATVTATASALSCTAGLLEATTVAATAEVERQVNETELAHDNTVTALENETEFATCMNDAKLELVGVETAGLAIEAAGLGAAAAQLDLRTQTKLAADTWIEGRQELASAAASRVRRPDVDLWIDEPIGEFDRQFRLARRATYLAVRAVEYEFQSSLAARADVIAAQTPEELEDVLFELWAASGTGGIGGSQPTDLKVVLSLKDELLQLADASSGAMAGELGLSDEERFKVLLQSEKYATYDALGNYEGQRIPFSVVPYGTLGIGETGGVGVLAGTDCAERLWSVNASIVGDGEFFVGSETTFSRIDLLKRNTFFSQWCTPQDPDAPFQTASVRPARNLFSEPGYGSDVANGELGLQSGAQEYSRARIEAFFNVPIGELESDDYANGETSELAARGLYGDYALFIPAALISQETDSGGRSDGIVLDAIDDILLRLDYVSVAQ